MRQLILNFSGKQRKVSPQYAPTPRSSRRCKLNIPLFYELTQDVRLMPHNPWAQIKWKRDILAKCNYPRLKVAKRESIGVYNARWERIGMAFYEIYDRVQKKYARA